MTTTELLSAMYQISKEGTKVALAESGLISPELTQAEAWRVFTRKTIERLVNKGKLLPRKVGGKVLFMREDIVLALLKDIAK